MVRIVVLTVTFLHNQNLGFNNTKTLEDDESDPTSKGDSERDTQFHLLIQVSAPTTSRLRYIIDVSPIIYP